MKKYFIPFISMIGLLSTVQAQKTAILNGEIPAWQNKGYLLVITEQLKFDTLKVSASGSFEYKMIGDKPAIRKLFLEYLGDDRTAIPVFLIPDKTSTVVIKGEYINGHLKVTPTFSGTLQKENEYLYATKDLWLNFKPNYFKADSSFITFKEYKNQVSDYQTHLLKLLKGTSKEFQETNLKVIEKLPEEVYFPYAWSAKYNNIDASKDADFMAYCQTIDKNDPKNLNIIDQWIRFFHAKELSQGIRTIAYFKLLREKISSREVRNLMADGSMDSYFAMGGDKNMKSIFEEYQKTSTNKEAISKYKALHDRLSKLLPGVKASDFEMNTTDGKSVHFHDIIGKGKITYIDFWATWCGPCCMEIPFVEKLAEKYKNNPNIEFISISLDNDVNKWHAKLDKDKPIWKQYIIPDNFNSTFAKEYNIRAIPRFMLFNKEGKIISINAPRPSDANIETYLNKYCK